MIEFSVVAFKRRNSSLSCFQIHLFDIDVPGKIRFQESETLSPGNSLSLFQTRERLFSLVPEAPPLGHPAVTPPPCSSLLPQPSVKWVWGFATTSDLQSWRSSTAGKVSVASSPWWLRPADPLRRPCVCLLSRGSAAGLPRSLQHDHRAGSLGAAAEGKVGHTHTQEQSESYNRL